MPPCQAADLRFTDYMKKKSRIYLKYFRDYFAGQEKLFFNAYSNSIITVPFGIQSPTFTLILLIFPETGE